MNDLEAIKARHSVRNYLSKSLDNEVLNKLHSKIDECNINGHLNIEFVTGETKAFSGFHSYGKFKGVENYFVMKGEKSPDLNFRIGYYGEKLVLLAQQLGLNTCWVGLTYKIVDDAFQLLDNEKVVCVISVGYGSTNGHSHDIKSVEKVSNADDTTPQWFRDGICAALLAPTAINQQKFYFEYLPSDNGKAKVRAKRKFSFVGYTEVDLGIANLHFEIGAGKENFEWD